MAKKKGERDSDAAYETEAEVDAAADAEGDFETEDNGDRVEVEIITDHIYLPLNAKGNVPTNWRSAPTVRVGKGTKLTVPGDMLEMLGDRVKASS